MRLIDADALLKALVRKEPFNDCARVVIAECMEEVRRAPTIETEPQWIPCSKRLPEDGRQVLGFARSAHFALAKYDEMREADGKYKKQWVTFDAWKPFYTIKEVIAWMPLPELYAERWKK